MIHCCSVVVNYLHVCIYLVVYINLHGGNVQMLQKSAIYYRMTAEYEERMCYIPTNLCACLIAG